MRIQLTQTVVATGIRLLVGVVLSLLGTACAVSPNTSDNSMIKVTIEQMPVGQYIVHAASADAARLSVEFVGGSVTHLEVGGDAVGAELTTFQVAALSANPMVRRVSDEIEAMAASAAVVGNN